MRPRQLRHLVALNGNIRHICRTNDKSQSFVPVLSLAFVPSDNKLLRHGRCMGATQRSQLFNTIHRCVRALSGVPSIFEGLRWGLEGGFRLHRRLIERHLPNNELSVLDCGCGTGIYAKHFSKTGYMGIDISEAYLRRARSRNPGYRFELMDATDLGFQNESFDAVITSGVIHHLANRDSTRVLSEIRRVLKPSGFLLLWEDIPTRSRINMVGWAVHMFDLGNFIRPSWEYASILDGIFLTESTEMFCSGFMDYAVFRCRPCTIETKVLV
jgi:SAM-dependent methyltransferase